MPSKPFAQGTMLHYSVVRLSYYGDLVMAHLLQARKTMHVIVAKLSRIGPPQHIYWRRYRINPT